MNAAGLRGGMNAWLNSNHELYGKAIIAEEAVFCKRSRG
jgi:hypothetical protein